MDNNPNNQEVDETAIVVESVEDDMRSHGIEVQESNQEEEAAEAGSAEAAATPGKEDEQQKPKKKSRAQRKIERQARELKEKDQEIEKLRNGGQESSASKEDGKVLAVEEIDIDDYEDFEEYQAAVKEAKEVAKSKADATTPEAKKEEGNEDKLNADLSKRIGYMQEDGAADYENFDEVVRNEELPLTQAVLEEITQSEQAADIAYFLGTNIDRAKKLAAMSPRQMAKEVLKIEIELEKKPNKVVRVSNAPDPINPVGGGNSAKGKTLDDPNTSYEEHEALLNSQKTHAKGGFL